MRLETTTEEQYTILKVKEEKLDSRISPDLKAEFIKQNTHGVKNIILNLEEVKYVDSSGLSAILTANRLSTTQEGILVICNINPHVEKLITISQLGTVLNLLPTESEAIEAVFMFELENGIKKETEGHSEESEAS